MPNDQAAMIAEVNRDLEMAGSTHRVETIGNPSLKDGVVMLRRLRRDFGAEAVERVKGHAFGMSIKADEEDRLIANSAANAALDEAIKLVDQLTLPDLEERMKWEEFMNRLRALKSTPSPEAT